MELKETLDMMLSDDYKERFKAEYYQLENRIEKLQKIVFSFGNAEFKPACSIDLLAWQLHAMREYKAVLMRRANVEGIKL